MKRLLIIAAALSLLALSIGGHYWVNTQPIAIVNSNPPGNIALPETNHKIIQFVILNGKSIAPAYDTAVCTEFIIQVMNHIKPLTRHEQKLIRIITDRNLIELIENDSAVIKGVQSALCYKNKGMAIDSTIDVLPGDFVQFWNIYGNTAYGHCGIVHSLDPGKNLTVYSSHPVTRGYGIQKFMWPEKIFFVRMK